jgi:hypothetical protein
MRTTARLLAHFPEARERLEELVRAERVVIAAAHGSPREAGGEVISLSQRLRQRAAAQRQEFLLPVAAQDEQSRVLLRHESVTLSVRAETLVVDFEEPVAEAPNPATLEPNDGEPVVLERTDPGRYELALSHPVLACSRATLRLEFSSKTLLLSLPPEDWS